MNHILFYHCINRKEFEEAEEIFNHINPNNAFYLQMQSELYLAQGRNDDAKMAIEQKLLGAAGDVQNYLTKLHSIALKEADIEFAEQLCEI